MLGLTVMSRVWQHVAHRPMSAAPGCPRVLVTIPVTDLTVTTYVTSISRIPAMNQQYFQLT